MSLPIRYSYSGADCRAVAYYDTDLAYENNFTTKITHIGSNTSSDEVKFAKKHIANIKEIISSGLNPTTGESLKIEEKIHWVSVMDETQKQINAVVSQKVTVKTPQPLVTLESLATISYSIYEAKSPVRALGHRAVKGYTKSIRTIAGSMVFLVIEDHPLAELVKANNLSNAFSKDRDSTGHSFRARGKKGEEEKRFISTMLKPFNIGLFYKTEVAFEGSSEKGTYRREHFDGAHLVISKINIISEGMVTSVNDMVTEITMQFVAENIFNVETTNSLATSQVSAKKTQSSKITAAEWNSAHNVHDANDWQVAVKGDEGKYS